MPVIKKQILCSLFIASSINFALYSQNNATPDNDNLFLILGDNNEEVYPLEDADINCFMADMPDSVHSLEIDPKDTHTALEQKMQADDVSTEQLIDGLLDVDTMQDALYNITKDQLEDILNEQFDQIDEYIIQPMSEIIAIDSAELLMPGNNGIILDSNFVTIPEQDNLVSFDEDEDDDIIPVPHDLINSVKKANKLKKKLEKKDRKEKAKFFKKSKKHNKK